jgi:hypothetical protein
MFCKGKPQMKTLFKIIVAPFKIVATFITILLMLVTAVTLILAGMFAYRASQPLDRPEFGGLSYFEYTQYREWAHAQNSLMVKLKKQYPEADLSCARFDRYDDVMLMGLGINFSKGSPAAVWTFFEDGLYRVDFKKEGLRFGRDAGCDIPLSPSIEMWQQSQTHARK